MYIVIWEKATSDKYVRVLYTSPKFYTAIAKANQDILRRWDKEDSKYIEFTPLPPSPYSSLSTTQEMWIQSEWKEVKKEAWN